MTRAKPLVSSCRASYLAASFATTVCASKELYLTAAVAAHEHSWYHLFSTTTPAPPSVCSQDALASKIHPYYFDCFPLGAPAASSPGAPKHSGNVPPAFLIRPLPHLPLGNLSPVVSPGTPSIYHTGIELRRHACWRLSPVPPLVWLLLWVYFWAFPTLSWLPCAGCVPACLCWFRDPGTPCRRCILQQAFLGRSVDGTRCPRDQSKCAPASRIRRLFLEASLLVMLSCLSYVPPMNSSISVVGIAWLPICMFWCHLASVESVLKRHVSHFSSISCNFHLLLHL